MTNIDIKYIRQYIAHNIVYILCSFHRRCWRLVR